MLCSWHFTLTVPLSTQERDYVDTTELSGPQENLTKYLTGGRVGVPCDALASYPGKEAVFLFLSKPV